MAPVGLTVGHVPFSNQSWWPEEKELGPETCVQFLLYCKTWSECRGQMVPPRQDLGLWPEEGGEGTKQESTTEGEG